MKGRLLLRDVDFQTYRALLSERFPDGARFAVTDDQGAVQIGDPDFSVANARDILSSVDFRSANDPQEPAARWVHAGDDTLCLVSVETEASQHVFYLWALMASGHKTRSAATSLARVAKLLAHELKLNVELDSMAAELTERYEELNLVYHTEDQVNYFAEGHDALHELVKNCRAYLDVDLAAVVMRERQIKVAYAGTGAADDRWEAVLKHVESSVYDAAVSDGSDVIINDARDPQLHDLWPFPGRRLLATPILDGKGNPTGLIILVNGIARSKFSNSDKNLLRVMARKASKIVQVGYDTLTGLVNREGFEFSVDKHFDNARHSGTQHALFFVDIDKLHVINDTVSVEAGDRVIRSVAAMLRASVRESDVVARFGGDEFGVLLEGCPLQRANVIAEKLRESIVDLHVPYNNRTLTVTVSIGVAPVDDTSESAASCLVSAELACDAAKELGKNRVQSYAPNDTGLIKRHHEMEAVGRIQTALKEGLFELFAQPIEPSVASATHGMHLEILLRMRDENDEMLTPAFFMPAAERYHLMPDIDRWVVTNTLEFLNEHAQPLLSRIGKVAINLSGQSLNEPGFMPFIEDALEGNAWPTDRLYFEITETAAVQDLDRAREFISNVKKHGCQFALDDFGSGLSSFTYLRSLPVDCLKIEGSIVKEIVRDPVSDSMVLAVKHIADVMGLETVAEYVESDAIKQRLVDIGVTYLQGWAIGKPRPLAEYVIASADQRGAATR